MLVIVPTRGRPENAVRLEKKRLEISVTTDVDFLFVVDDDDPKCMDYCRLGLEKLAVIHRQRLGPTLNMMAVQHMDDYDALGFMGDDHLPQTPAWDAMVVQALALSSPLPDLPRIVYGNDLLQGANLPTAVFMDARIVRALGGMVPPGMVHLYLDNYWKALGERLGTLVYLDHVVIEHLHPAAGKAAMDAGYQEANASAVDHADRAAWLAFESDGRLDRAADLVRVSVLEDIRKAMP
jgi:hypothetical protein